MSEYRRARLEHNWLTCGRIDRGRVLASAHAATDDDDARDGFEAVCGEVVNAGQFVYSWLVWFAQQGRPSGQFRDGLRRNRWVDKGCLYRRLDGMRPTLCKKSSGLFSENRACFNFKNEEKSLSM